MLRPAARFAPRLKRPEGARNLAVVDNHGSGVCVPDRPAEGRRTQNSCVSRETVECALSQTTKKYQELLSVSTKNGLLTIALEGVILNTSLCGENTRVVPRFTPLVVGETFMSRLRA